ncbi:MAG TPA: lysophospholipid acyltransferase family protein, partial [Devosiaceae bacterium]|nr:lysophospholipid acyltransferase family protein [Devosiaceae bacterium]
MILRLAFFVLIVLPYTIAFLPVQIVIVVLRLPGWHILPRGFHWLLCRLLSLRLTVIGRPYAKAPTLLLCNHISWMDIPAIGSIAPLVFVSKSDVRRWPLVGPMAALQKTIFVDRRRRTDSARTSSEMAARLAGGSAVLLFAEGTSGMGTHVLPFRSALVGAVQGAMASSGATEMVIQPVTIAYTHIHGLPLGRTDRSLVAWVGDMGVGDNLRDILTSGTKSVTVMFGEPVVVTPTTNRKVVTRFAEIKVREMLVAINRRTELPAA